METKTGDVLRMSASGNVIDTVRTDPRLVPSHSVGMSVDGSGECSFIQITKNIGNVRMFCRRPKRVGGRARRQIGCQLTALLCITINKR